MGEEEEEPAEEDEEGESPAKAKAKAKAKATPKANRGARDHVRAAGEELWKMRVE